MFTYVTTLLYYDDLEIAGGSIANYARDIEEKYGKDYSQLFETAWQLNQLAIYSRQKMTQAEVAQMKEFYNNSLQIVLKDKKIYEKFKMKYVDFVYDKA